MKKAALFYLNPDENLGLATNLWVFTRNCYENVLDNKVHSSLNQSQYAQTLFAIDSFKSRRTLTGVGESRSSDTSGSILAGLQTITGINFCENRVKWKCWITQSIHPCPFNNVLTVSTDSSFLNKKSKILWNTQKISPTVLFYHNT